MSWFDWYSAVGTSVTLIGFAVTLYQVNQARKEAKSAKEYAELAEKAANNAVNELRRFESVVNFSSVITALHEVRRLQRDKIWAALPERYSEARSMLISAREASKQLTDIQRSRIQNAIVNFRQLEEIILEAAGNYGNLPVNEMMKQSLIDIDDIVEIFHQIRLTKPEG